MSPINLISDNARLNLLLAYLNEDAARGDITTESLGITASCKAEIVAKQQCVLAGILVTSPLLHHFDITINSNKQDGTECPEGEVVLGFSGAGPAVLKLERLLLNIIGRMSGIATATRKLVDEVSKVNPDCLIAATRKTTPGFRIFEKEAVMIGGGHPHRFDLAEAVMIKDNHLKFVPDPAEALKLAGEHVSSLNVPDTKLAYGSGKPRHKQKWIEIEADNIDLASIAAKAGADIIMLDNMSPEQAGTAAKQIRSIDPDIKIEISGGITPENIIEYAKFADIISLGWLTHSAPAADFSMNITVE